MLLFLWLLFSFYNKTDRNEKAKKKKKMQTQNKALVQALKSKPDV